MSKKLFKIGDNLFIEPIFKDETGSNDPFARIFMSDMGHHLISILVTEHQIKEVLHILDSVVKGRIY